MKHYSLIVLLALVVAMVASPASAQKVKKEKSNPTKVVVKTNSVPKEVREKEKPYTPAYMTKEQRRQWNTAGNTHGWGNNYSKTVETNNIVFISQAEAQRIIDTDRNAVLVDVRPRKEYKNGHLDHAICLPYEFMAENNVRERLPRKNQLILVYCRSGQKSVKAAARLQQLGYRNVRVVTGILLLTNPVVKTKK